MRKDTCSFRAAARRRLYVDVWLGLALGLLAISIPVPSEAANRTGVRPHTGHTVAMVRVAAGDGHSCRVHEDGTVRCWGRNDFGQLGDGGTSWTGSPVTVVGLTNAVAVTAGYAHSCALLADGSMRCWGRNDYGQLGDGSLTRRLTPVAVSGLTGVTAIAAGAFHTCALRVDSGAVCWGLNDSGQLRRDRSTPFLAVPGSTGAFGRAIAAGGAHTCVVLSESVVCWGRNDRGQLGNGGAAAGSVQGLGSEAVAIALGNAHSCALLVSGEVRCWGAGTAGQLGSGDPRDETVPVGVVGMTRATALVAGFQHSCALLADGSARCWGDNSHGQLGHGDGPRSTSPAVVPGLAQATALVAGARHGCAALADGQLRCWGRNLDGEQGIGVRDDSPGASTVLGSGGSVMARAVAAGRNHSCALRANGSVACWGRNDFGQAGNGGFGAQLVPGTVAGVADAVAVAAGGRHSCALVADGSVRCWGANDRGQLGDGTLNASPLPVAVVGVSQALAITAGADHSCALLVGGAARCWGANGSAQLGDLSLIDRLTALPAPVGRARALAAGDGHTCAVLADRLTPVQCWGDNSFRQTGAGSGFMSLTPITVQEYDPVVNATFDIAGSVDIAPGGMHSCALDGGGVKCWGSNDFDQLGVARPTGPLATVVSGQLYRPLALASGFAHSCTVHGDGTARCWGENGAGQLGDTTKLQRQTPSTVSVPYLKRTPGGATYAIAPLAQVVQVAAGRRHSCLLRANGAVHCTGENSFGQLGLGTTTEATHPAPVPSFTLNIDPAATLAHGPRVATVTLLAACSAGQALHFDVTLRQDGALGQRRGTTACSDGLAHVPVALPAQGRDGFDAGPALVEATARIVEQGLVVDTQSWTRRVQLQRVD